MVAIVGIVCGFCLGIVVAIQLFAIKIDLLGVPYANSPIVTTVDMYAMGDTTQISIPKGTPLVYLYTAKDVSFYALPLIEEPFTEGITWESSPQRRYLTLMPVGP